MCECPSNSTTTYKVLVVHLQSLPGAVLSVFHAGHLLIAHPGLLSTFPLQRYTLAGWLPRMPSTGTRVSQLRWFLPVGATDRWKLCGPKKEGEVGVFTPQLLPCGLVMVDWGLALKVMALVKLPLTCLPSALETWGRNISLLLIALRECTVPGERKRTRPPSWWTDPL